MILLGKWRVVKTLEYYIYYAKIPSHFLVQHFLSYFQGNRNRHISKSDTGALER